MYEHDNQDCMDKPSIGHSGQACSTMSNKKLSKDEEFNEAQAVEHGPDTLDPSSGNGGHALHDGEERDMGRFPSRIPEEIFTSKANTVLIAGLICRNEVPEGGTIGEPE